MGTIEGKEAKKFAGYADRSGNLFRKIVEITSPKKSDYAVVLADGSGNFSEILKEEVGGIVSVEMSEEMIQFLRKKFKKSKNVQVLKGDIRAVALKEKLFDKAYIVRAIHHVKQKKEVYLEAFRILKPDGLLIVADTFFKGNWFERLIFPIKWELLYRRSLSWDESCPLFTTEKELRKDLTEAGFEVIAISQLNAKVESGRKIDNRFIAVAKRPLISTV